MPVPISVIITVYNRERYLSQAIDSVLAQTRKNFELLIWDDGSTDRSVEIAHSYAQQDPRVRLVEAKHLGQGQALKSAINGTTGAYIGQVDSDDFLAPTALEETAAILDTYPEVGLVYTDYMVMDEAGRIKGQGRRCQIPYSKERLLVDFMIFHFRLIRRSVYDQVGGINEVFESVEDYDLCLRLSEVTQVWQVKRPLYYYRNHPKSLSHDKQIEQMLLSHKAISQALERRGLSDRFQVNLQIVGKFSLQEKM
ncbi:glycosyltransferase [Coleofasciculus sp. E2-BRE-01]|uniref:glycosyltransferase n=1 Tax=Coleofasciculus sp. E2-BRE-01 TaxID=3069524 RepID=UPI0032F991AC